MAGGARGAEGDKVSDVERNSAQPLRSRSGRYDEVMPACVETIHPTIGELVGCYGTTFPIPHRKEMDQLIQVLSAFFNQVEASASL